METSSKNSDNYGESNCAGLKWSEVKQFQHRYLIDISSNLEKPLQDEIELPYPAFNPVQITDYSCYRELFKPKPKLDTRLAYCKTLYAKTNKRAVKELINDHEYATLPQYVVDVAYGAFQDNKDRTWCYTGGTLDCLFFNDHAYTVKAGLQQKIQIIDLYAPNTNVDIQLKENTPVYSVKSASYDEEAFFAVRQKNKLSLFHLSHSDGNLKTDLAWKYKTLDSFVDMSFNNFKRNQISALDSSHNLKVKDFVKNKSVINYNFQSDFTKLDDHFGQIMYINCNTVAFINRCCFNLLDLRSLNIQKTCLKTDWLKCNDVCTFSNTSKDANCLYISTVHNVGKFDIRSRKYINKIMHMLSAPPFISTCIADSHGEYICLSSQYMNDKVLLHTSSDSLSTPKCIPNIKDTLAAASLVKRLNICNNLEERLLLPTLGMKLCKSNPSDDISLYTLNSVGDVFKQKFLQTKPENTGSINRLAEWGNTLSYKPKVLEATSICNLSNIMHNISSCFSEAKILSAFMKESRSQEEFEKELCHLTKYLEGSVGESMNSIWDVEKIITDESNVERTSEISSKSKVSEWLASTSGV